MKQVFKIISFFFWGLFLVAVLRKIVGISMLNTGDVIILKRLMVSSPGIVIADQKGWLNNNRLNARIAFNNGDARQAIKWYQKSLAEEPNDVLSLQGIGEAYIFVGETTKGIDYYIEAGGQVPLRNKISEWVAKQDWQDANYACRKMLDLYPDDWNLANICATVHFKGLHDPNSAIQILFRARENYSQDCQIYSNLSMSIADIFEVQNQWTNVIEVYQNSLIKCPSVSVIFTRLAWAKYNENAVLSDSILLLSEAAQTAKAPLDWYEYFFTSGELAMRRMDFTDAINQFKKAILYEPNIPWPWIAIGQSERGIGDYEASVNALRLAIVKFPTEPYGSYELAVSYYQIGEKDRSRAIIDKLIEGDPANEQYLALSALLYEDNGQISEAITVYEKILQLNPENVDAKQALQRLLGN